MIHYIKITSKSGSRTTVINRLPLCLRINKTFTFYNFVKNWGCFKQFPHVFKTTLYFSLRMYMLLATSTTVFHHTSAFDVWYRMLFKVILDHNNIIVRFLSWLILVVEYTVLQNANKGKLLLLNLMTQDSMSTKFRLILLNFILEQQHLSAQRVGLRAIHFKTRPDISCKLDGCA